MFTPFATKFSQTELSVLSLNQSEMVAVLFQYPRSGLDFRLFYIWCCIGIQHWKWSKAFDVIEYLAFMNTEVLIIMDNSNFYIVTITLSILRNKECSSFTRFIDSFKYLISKVETMKFVFCDSLWCSLQEEA